MQEVTIDLIFWEWWIHAFLQNINVKFVYKLLHLEFEYSFPVPFFFLLTIRPVLCLFNIEQVYEDCYKIVFFIFQFEIEIIYHDIGI